MMMFDLVARSTTLARTGASPVQCAESLSFGAIFTDIEPPDATGDNLCREPVSCTRGVAQTPHYSLWRADGLGDRPGAEHLRETPAPSSKRRSR